MIAVRGKSGLLQEIMFIYFRVEQAVIARENVMGKVVPEEAMKSLCKEGLEIERALINGNHPGVIAIVKGDQEEDIRETR